MSTPRAHTREHHFSKLTAAVARQRAHRDAMLAAARELAANKQEQAATVITTAGQG